MFYIESVLKQNNPYTELKTPPKSVYSVQSVYPPTDALKAYKEYVC